MTDGRHESPETSTGLGFSITHNTPSDWLKGVFAAIAAVTPVVIGATSDNVVSGTEVITILTTVLLTFGAALGFYQKKETQ